MSDARAIIIAAVITSVTAVVAMLITVICNLIFNERQRNKESRERFFYEMYQRRLALYDEIIKALYIMGNPERKNREMSFRDFASKLLNDYYDLTTLVNRLRLFGSPKTKKILNAARTHLKTMLKEDFKVPGFGINVIYMGRVSRRFTRCVAAETGKDFIDATIDSTLKELTREKDKKPLCRKSSSPIDTDNSKHLDRGKKTNTNDEKINTNNDG
jgi:hypothetical protein